ncbi:hypothetical protein TNIN_198011 [Trichonephila inaurata madagascariensis]|uniref:Uncharacterized protein n=1 Tax=Trichonephila inaurata madagascariensis TaxID=2747483 RepID=A0A8X6M8U5_9ARAC|nr:hypothetical protein TNIN_198011 [Trichonephila inaurata madagascariensis]
MHSISSKYRKLKGRLSKRRAACIRNLEKGKSSPCNSSSDNKCDEISTEAVPSTSVTAVVSEVNIGYAETLKLNNSEMGDAAIKIAHRRDYRRWSQGKRKASEQYKKREKNSKT